MKITNMQKGPRGLNAFSGPVLVEPGQTVDVELSPAEALVARGTGWFAIEEVEEPTPKQDGTALTPAELLVKVDEFHFQTFKAEARKILGDETPETKDAIIAALQAKV